MDRLLRRHRTGPSNWQYLIARPDFLPEEDAMEYEALKHALMAEHNPQTPYETIHAADLVLLEWEMRRQRRLYNDVFMAAFRDEAAKLIVGPEHFDYRMAGQDWDDRQQAEAAAQFTAGALVGSDPELRQQAEEILAKVGYQRREVVGRAAVNAADRLERHEDRIAELEQRRRRLRDDLDRMKRGRSLRSDAETIEAA